MNPLKTRISSGICVFLAFLILVSLFPVSMIGATDGASSGRSYSSGSNSSGSSDSATEPTDRPRIHAAYSFDNEKDLTAELGGKYPLSTETFGKELLRSASGHREGGMYGYVSLNSELFKDLHEFSMGFWVKTSVGDAKNKVQLLSVVDSKNAQIIELKLDYVGTKSSAVLTVKDNSNTATATFDLTDLLEETPEWHHMAFTFKKAGSEGLLTLYADGKYSAQSSVQSKTDLSSSSVQAAMLRVQTGMILDELYLTNVALSANKIASMMNQPIDSFYTQESREMSGSSVDTPNAPVKAHAYSWAAYLFDGSYAAGTDLHEDGITAIVDANCTRIDSAKLVSKFGSGIIRRSNTAPSSYMQLDSRLFQGQPQFTFAAWVYRSGNSETNGECLLDLSGNGTLRFAPYATDPDGKAAPFIQYVDSRGTVQHKTIGSGSLASPNGAWVHYALTVSSSGDIAVYVNGVSVASFASGVNPANLNFSSCKVVTGSSSSDSTRTVIDEVYVRPEALSAAEIRKICYYGLSQYTSQVLPDPGTIKDDKTDESNPYVPTDSDLEEDAYAKTGRVVGGFIGTTFDDRSGRDFNNGAEAKIVGGKYSQGIASYGFSLDGNSYLRYPLGILDGADSLTVSLSYYWEGPTAGNENSQRLFDFSRKTSSVADPTAYFYLEMGTGISGLLFRISDGMETTTVTCNYNAVNTWTRITVTVENGLITLYLNDQSSATATTKVDVSSICPNFCYVGRSGNRENPNFKGTVDEIYISDKALSENQVGKYLNGIAATTDTAPKDDGKKSGRLPLILGLVGLAVVLVGTVITVIVIRRRERTPKAEKPADPPMLSGQNPADLVLGPRSARRARMEAEAAAAEEGSTVSFRKVDAESVDSFDPEATATFRKIASDMASDETVQFQKLDSDSE